LSTVAVHLREADLAMKSRALARLDEPPAALRRYRAADTIMAFLQTCDYVELAAPECTYHGAASSTLAIIGCST